MKSQPLPTPERSQHEACPFCSQGVLELAKGNNLEDRKRKVKRKEKKKTLEHAMGCIK